MGDTADARRLAAESQTRRGLEDSVRLLDEQLGRASQRAESESKHRREAERRAAHLEAEMASLRAEMASAVSTIHHEEGDRQNRELRERAANQRLDAALADRAALEATTQELRGEAEVLAQRLEAEGRARSSLSEQLSVGEREIEELRTRLLQQRQASADASEAYRALELAHREAARRAEDALADAASTGEVLRETREELELLQRRHDAETEARQGQVATEQLRAEELSEARRAADTQARLVSELQQAEAGHMATAQNYRTQLQYALTANAELQNQMRALTTAADESSARASEAERGREAASATAARAAEEVRELKVALEASVARERRGEQQRVDLQSSNDHLRLRVEEAARARAALDDALRLRAATRAALPPPAALPAPPAEIAADRTSIMAEKPAVDDPALASVASSSAHATPATTSLNAAAPPPPRLLPAAPLSASARFLENPSLLSDPALVDHAGVLTGHEEVADRMADPPPPSTASFLVDTYASAPPASSAGEYRHIGEPDAGADDGSLAGYRDDMRLTARQSAFETQLRAVRDAVPAEARPAAPATAPASDAPLGSMQAAHLGYDPLPGASSTPAFGGSAAVANSPLESRKRELSDELRRLKARLQPLNSMGPPPPRPPTAQPPRGSMAPPMPPTAAGVNGCDPASSPAGGSSRGAAFMATPATQAGGDTPRGRPGDAGDGDSAATTPSATPIAPAFQSVARGGGIGGVSIGSASSRNSQLGELEMSQKLLEEKLAALKRKMGE